MAQLSKVLLASFLLEYGHDALFLSKFSDN